MPAEQVEIICFETSRLLNRYRAAQVTELKCFGDRLHDRVCNFILHREYVFELSLVGLRPESGIVLDADEARSHTQSRARASHTCFENESNTESRANFLDWDVAAPERK